MKAGFVKTYRKLLQSDIWKMPPLYYRVFHYLILVAEYKKNMFPTRKKFGIHLLPGQLITSMGNIANAVAWEEHGVERIPNKKMIKDVLEWLEFHEMVTVVSNAHGTYIEVVNYRLYHDFDCEKVTEKVTQKKRRVDTPKEVKEVKEEKNKDIIPNWVPKEEWREFVKMRIKIKKPMTDFAIKLAISKLEKLKEEGHNPTKVLVQSIERSYQGLFPVANKQEDSDGMEWATPEELAAEEARRKRYEESKHAI